MSDHPSRCACLRCTRVAYDAIASLNDKVDHLANLLHAEGVCEIHGRAFIPECSGCCAAAASGRSDAEIARPRAEVACRVERDALRERMNQIAQWQRPKPHWPADCACELCSPNSAWNVLNPVAERDALLSALKRLLAAVE